MDEKYITNLHANNLKNGLYKLYKQMKVDNTEFSIYIKKNKITFKPYKQDWEIYKNDKLLGIYNENIVVYVIMETYIKPKAIDKTANDVYNATRFEDLIATLAISN